MKAGEIWRQLREVDEWGYKYATEIFYIHEGFIMKKVV